MSRAKTHYQTRPPELQVALLLEEGHVFMREATVTSSPNEEFAARIQAWLDTVGLQFNPFASNTLNSADDANLGQYLVGHDAFAQMWGDWVSTVLAPTGGGKSAFRVRLAYAARIGEDGRRVFPIVYTLPSHCRTLTDHLEVLAENAAYELLLKIAHRPGWFESLTPETRILIRAALDQNAPGWTRFLPQLERKGVVTPLAETFDRSAAHLPTRPRAQRVREVCSMLRAIPPDSHVLPIKERWQQLIGLLLDRLQFEAVYVLVDGADAYPETIRDPELAVRWLTPLLAQADSWSTSRVFLKLFLPDEVQPSLEKFRANLLTFPARFVKIVWTIEGLIEVLAARLRVASAGEFDSLDAICLPALRGLLRELASMARPPVPREVVALAGHIFLEHVRRPESGELLQPEDLEAVRVWYRLDRSVARSP